jgi:transposase-like protein
MLDSRVVDLRMVYTDDIPCPTSCQEPNVAGQYQEFDDDVQCYKTVHELRWPEGIVCPSCQSTQVIKRGFDDTEPARQRYECTRQFPLMAL